MRHRDHVTTAKLKHCLCLACIWEWLAQRRLHWFGEDEMVRELLVLTLPVTTLNEDP